MVSVQSSNCIWRHKSTGEIAIFIELNVAGYIHTYIYIHIYIYLYIFFLGRQVCLWQPVGWCGPARKFL